MNFHDILLIIPVVFWCIQLGYWVLIFSRLAFYQETTDPSVPGSSVSVIICAKNEAVNLKNNLPALLKQHYPPGFEVIVVNDGSTDVTAQVLDALADRHGNLQVIHLQGQAAALPGKKYALQKAAEIAQFQLLLFTDADCHPASDQWIQLMASRLENNYADVCLGIAPINGFHSLLAYWARFEAWHTAMQYLAYALVGIPYMGVGRNLMYRKRLFDPASLQPDLIGGDDDLMLQALSQKKFSWCLDPRSFMHSDPPPHWKAYIDQKYRHVSAAPGYRSQSKALLSLYGASQIGFWMLIWFLPLVWILLLVGSRWVLQFLIWRKICNHFKENHYRWSYPLLDMGLAVFYLLLIPGVLVPRKSW